MSENATKCELLEMVLAAAAALALSALLASSCASTGAKAPFPPRSQEDFAQYAAQARAFVAQRRRVVSSRPLEEIAWNSPAQWRPKGPADKGILLIHGLGDSPFTFSDLGPALAKMGFLARAVLLPGCGTRPEDHIGIELDDWRQAVAEQARLHAK